MKTRRIGRLHRNGECSLFKVLFIANMFLKGCRNVSPLSLDIAEKLKHNGL
jgi:hypothetical protein